MELVLRGVDENFTELESQFKLPEGYVVGSVAKYPEGVGVTGVKLGYTVAVQLIQQKLGLICRGTGDSVRQALENAISNVKARGM